MSYKAPSRLRLWKRGASRTGQSRQAGRHTLQQGDVIYMGTPAGVGAVQRGDVLTGGIDGIADFTVKVA